MCLAVEVTFEKTLLFRVTAVTTDTLEHESNIYKINYILETSADHDIPVENTYQMVIENVAIVLFKIIPKVKAIV